jgi:isochorismate hydrolase
LQVPVWGTEQSPDKLGPSLPAIGAACARTLAKIDFDATAAGLLEMLQPGRDAGRGNVVIAGCEAHVCLLQTALGLLAAGFAVWVVNDACGSRRASDHAAATARLARAGAQIVTTEMVGFEWLRRADHAAFKRWQAAIR